MKIIFLFILVGCASVKSPSEIAIEATMPDIQKPGLGDPVQPIIGTEKPKIDYVKIFRCTNCTPEQSAKIAAAAVLVNEIAKSECFKKEVLSSSFLETDLTPQQIYDELTKETTTIETETYWTFKRVLGYTLGGPKIWVNRRYMMSWSTLDLASLISHETAHVKGFKHAFNYYKGRENTVPYSLNRIIEKCGGN